MDSTKILKSKNVLSNKFRRVLSTSLAVAVIGTGLLGTSSVQAKSVEQTRCIEVDLTKDCSKFLSNSEETELEIEPLTPIELDMLEALESNNDYTRRAALENTLGIKLSDGDIWLDKKGEITIDYRGKESPYTSHDQLKAAQNYAINANKQELIQYGVRTDNWDPYRIYAAQRTPAHFELVDGKYEYNKIYYGHLVQAAIFHKNSLYQKYSSTDDPEYLLEKEQLTNNIKEYIKDFNEAPGIVPYVVGLNHTESLAKEYGVPMVNEDFYDSKYNDPDVFYKGIFKK